MAVKKQSFMNGVLVIMVSQIAIKVMGFLYRIILTNFPEFSNEGNSYYGSGYQIYTFILAIATMGIPNTMSKLISEKLAVGDKRGAHRIFRTAMGLFTSIAVMFALGLFLGSGFIATNILHNPGVKYTLMALSPAIIFVAMSAVLRGYFVGMQNMTEYSKAQILEQIINSIFSVIFVMMLIGTDNPAIMAAGSTLATTVATSSAFIYLLLYYNRNKKDIWTDIKNSEKFALDTKPKIIRKLLVYGMLIALGSVVSALSGVIDVVTVVDGLQKSGYTLQEANEKFGIIVGKVDILNAVPMSINVAFSVALVPFISAAMARHRKDEAVNKINYSLKISSIIALPCTVGMFILAKPIFELIFPNSPDGYNLLQIQCWQLIFAVLSQTIYGSLQGLGKLHVPGICLTIGALIKCIMNVTLIPIYREYIPVISSVISFLIAFVVLFKVLKEKPNLKEIFLKPALATCAMAIVTILSFKGLSYINVNSKITTIVTICIAVVAYLLFTINFKVLAPEEVEQLPFGNKLSKIFANKKKK